MNTQSFIDDFVQFIHTQPCVIDFDEVHVIVNPAAGGFTRRNFFKKTVSSFHYWRSKLQVVETNLSPANIHLHCTKATGDCETIVRGIINTYSEQKRVLFITFGGDGTATEAASEIFKFSIAGGTSDNFVLFRLPFGTGNDGLDAESMDSAFQICGSSCVPSKIPLLQIDFNSGDRKYAANIASFGLDAYVTDKTNKLKQIIPGSFYSVMVDVAVLFYETTVKMDPIHIDFTDFSGEKREQDITMLLLAMGVSGNRTYGGGKLVLPDENNVCAIGPMKLLRKFSVKKPLYEGTHTSLEEVSMFNAKEMTVNFSDSMLFQHDGEVVPLTKEDFPVKLKTLGPSVQVLRTINSTIPKGLSGK